MVFAQLESNGENGNEICPNSCKNLLFAINKGHLQASTQEQQSKGADNLASVMTVYECREALEEKDGDLTYFKTDIILRNGDELFFAETKDRYKHDADIPLDKLDIEPIKIDHIWPLFPQDFTMAPNSLPINSYFKPSPVIFYDKKYATTSSPSGLLLEEARTCEILRKNPHPNIVEYLGCVVHENRITGLCLAKYGATLTTIVDQMAHKNGQFDPISLMKGIEAGVRHLHKLGLVHNDLNPSNIMIDAENGPRIIDFDSCQKVGQPLGYKCGTPGWFDGNAKFALPENDHYGLTKLRDYLSLPVLSPSC